MITCSPVQRSGYLESVWSGSGSATSLARRVRDKEWIKTNTRTLNQKLRHTRDFVALLSVALGFINAYWAFAVPSQPEYLLAVAINFGAAALLILSNDE
jgi:hypothetical protein